MTDLQIARKYVTKANNAKRLKHEFSLTFTEFKRLMKKKNCSYSGVKLTDEPEKFNSRTIDRIDNKFGYIAGNVVAVAYGINTLKGRLENPIEELNIDILFKTAKKLKEIM